MLHTPSARSGKNAFPIDLAAAYFSGWWPIQAFFWLEWESSIAGESRRVVGEPVG